MTPVVPPVASMGHATPTPSASPWGALPQGPAPPPLVFAVCSLSPAGGQAVRITHTPQ